MKKRILFVALIAAIAVVGASAADLTISTQVNMKAADYAGNFFTFKGAIGASDKDQYVPVDATSGASKFRSTETFNPYRTDVQGKKLLPAGLRGLFLYGVADYGTLTGDNLNVSVAANGVITIQSCHRGTAYKLVTTPDGKLTFPGANCTMRVIGTTSNMVHPDFSPTGKTADIDWAKVWDASIPDGKVIGTTTTKTGKILPDEATSVLFGWAGSLQVAFDGTYLKVNGELNAVNK
ncbi:MAG TPA: hypothetical protein PLT87_07120 [Spirochaetales bacterium]|nr:hypothetical protein [Spirochaetales bacterium]